MNSNRPKSDLHQRLLSLNSKVCRINNHIKTTSNPRNQSPSTGSRTLPKSCLSNFFNSRLTPFVFPSPQAHKYSNRSQDYISKLNQISIKHKRRKGEENKSLIIESLQFGSTRKCLNPIREKLIKLFNNKNRKSFMKEKNLDADYMKDKGYYGDDRETPSPEFMPRYQHD